ncbi:MAG: hypothetical protein K6F46_03680 [Desulfovibrio sp.]|nr:hypothetical protein [Desulfovibrio sp.]
MSQVANNNPQVPINNNPIIDNNPNVGNVNEQPRQNVQNAPIGQPRPDLPPELHNARPAKPGILSRISAFIFGKGPLSAVGKSYLTSLAIGTVAATIATGPIGLIAGAIGLGFYAGLRALVSYIAKSPAPEPRVPENSNNLPNANPEADAYNTRIANDIVAGRELTGSLKTAADGVVTQMRQRYGENFVPQGATLTQLLGGEKNKLANEIKALDGNVNPQKMQELVEKHMKTKMAITALENAFKPLCGQNDNKAARLREIAAEKNPQLLEDLKNAQDQQAVQNILNGRTDEFRSMAALYETAHAQREVTKGNMITSIAQKLQLDPETVRNNVNFRVFEIRLRELESSVVRGQVAQNAVAEAFSNLAEELAEQYRVAFQAVDADQTLSEQTRKALKMWILKSHPSNCSTAIQAGKNVNVTELKNALAGNAAREEVNRILSGLGVQLNDALKNALGEDAWAAMNRDHARDIEALQVAAFLAMFSKEKVSINNEEKTLLEVLRSRTELNVFDAMRGIQNDEGQSEAAKRGAYAIERGYSTLTQLPDLSEEFDQMQRPNQIIG